MNADVYLKYLKGQSLNEVNLTPEPGTDDTLEFQKPKQTITGSLPTTAEEAVNTNADEIDEIASSGQIIKYEPEFLTLVTGRLGRTKTNDHIAKLLGKPNLSPSVVKEEQQMKELMEKYFSEDKNVDIIKLLEEELADAVEDAEKEADAAEGAAEETAADETDDDVSEEVPNDVDAVAEAFFMFFKEEEEAEEGEDDDDNDNDDAEDEEEETDVVKEAFLSLFEEEGEDKASDEDEGEPKEEEAEEKSEESDKKDEEAVEEMELLQALSAKVINNCIKSYSSKSKILGESKALTEDVIYIANESQYAVLVNAFALSTKTNDMSVLEGAMDYIQEINMAQVKNGRIYKGLMAARASIRAAAERLWKRAKDLKDQAMKYKDKKVQQFNDRRNKRFSVERKGVKTTYTPKPRKA